MGVTYHKVYRSDDTSFSPAEVYGGLREYNKQVFYFDPRLNRERILYDFGVKTGDTVRYTTGSSVDPFYLVQAVVSTIDTLMIAGIPHRQIHFHQFGSTSDWPFGTWVEGVGNIATGGFHKSVTQLATCDCSDKLVCFSGLNTWAYQNPEYITVDCDHPPTVGIEEQTASSRKAIVFPNPLPSGVRTLQYRIPEQGIALNLYAFNGVLIEKYTLAPYLQELNLKDYPSGMYWYRIEGRSGNVYSGSLNIW
ncbi:hypothetical protein GCM10023092_16530 [Rurimicrobium arvi]|uniref:T9SS type A sorting domain-containing protein n=2 Tax=Rurimicrobium arvi TaxID=2049916 RepID=A0ABP8MSZ1_9BACT